MTPRFAVEHDAGLWWLQGFIWVHALARAIRPSAWAVVTCDPVKVLALDQAVERAVTLCHGRSSDDGFAFAAHLAALK